MRTSEKFVEDAVRRIAGRRDILSVGSGREFGKGLGKFQHFLQGQNYKTLDIDPDVKPDIVHDVCQGIPLPDESVDAIICLSVLEHLYDPFAAVRGMRRVLRPGGLLLFYVPFLYPDHSAPGRPDYYRYTRDGIEHLFREFGRLELCPVRGNAETVLNLVPGLRKIPVLTALTRLLDRRLSGRQASGFTGLAEN